MPGAAFMPNEQVIDQIRDGYVRDPRIQHPAQVAVTEKTAR